MTQIYLAEHVPADLDLALTVINSPVGDDGISEWTWLRLANGDLMLGIFPHGGLYEKIESAVSKDYIKATAADAVERLTVDLDQVL